MVKVMFDIKDTIKEASKEMSQQQRENKMHTMALILRCKVNGNDLEVRGHDPGKTIDAFEQLKTHAKEKLTEGNVEKNNEGE